MKTSRRTVAVVACLVSMASAAAAQNVSVRDYDVPISHAQSLLLDLSYDYQKVDRSTITNDAGARADYRLFYDSLPLAYSVDVAGSGSRTWLREDSRFVSDFALQATGRFNKYLWDGRDLFAAIAGRGQLLKDDDQPATALTLGIGVGRRIDATALRRAVRVDHALLDEGVTSGRLPKTAMLELARLLEQEDQYRETFGGDSYRQRWYTDIEKVLRRSRMLISETLGPVGVLRMEEVLFRENIGDRFFGSDLTVGVRYDVTLADRDAPRPVPSLDLSFRYARPLSWTTQIDGESTLTTPMDSADAGRIFELSSFLRFLYELTDRVDFRIDYALDVLKADRSESVTASHSIVPGFLFYVENEVRLLVGMRVAKPTSEPWSRELSIAMHYKAF